MKVYGALISPFVRKVVVALKLKGLDYELVTVIPGATPPEYQSLSPLKKIPAFEDGDTAMCDSSVICEYLEEQYPDIPLRPNTPALKAKSRWFEEYADSKLIELCGGGIFFERIGKPLMMQLPTDEAKVTETIEVLLPEQLAYLESVLPEDGFVFEEFGICDISLAGPFINAGYADYHPDPTQWPKLTSYLERVKTQPVVTQVLAEEAEMLSAMIPK